MKHTRYDRDHLTRVRTVSWYINTPLHTDFRMSPVKTKHTGGHTFLKWPSTSVCGVRSNRGRSRDYGLYIQVRILVHWKIMCVKSYEMQNATKTLSESQQGCNEQVITITPNLRSRKRKKRVLTKLKELWECSKYFTLKIFKTYTKTGRVDVTYLHKIATLLVERDRIFGKHYRKKFKDLMTYRCSADGRNTFYTRFEVKPRDFYR